jgi:hypothetical protein
LKTARRPAPIHAAETSIHICKARTFGGRSGNRICTVLRYRHTRSPAIQLTLALPIGRRRTAHRKRNAVRVFVVASGPVRGLWWSTPDDSPC